MAKEARDYYLDKAPHTAESALATIASGKNPDGSDFTLPVDAQGATFQAGDIEIGAVELKNGADDTRAKIGAGTSLLEGDNALAVRDPKAVSTLVSILAALSALGISTFKGAANVAIGNVTAGSTSGAAVAARATRRSALVRNEHASDSCRVGPGTVSASVGFLLKAGEAVEIETTAAINAIRTGSADVPLSFLEEYD
jgi:hypothetical protein